MANFETNEIMNEGVELMVEDVVADGGTGIGTGYAILIGAGLACVVGAGIKLAKKGIEAYRAKKELHLVNEEDLAKSEDMA